MIENMDRHTFADLKQRQSLPLQQKIRLTKMRIKEWYEYYDGMVYVAFSGGKDSTVLLHLVRSIYPEVPAVFSDTGLEWTEIREFVKTIPNVTWIKPKMDFRTVITTKGYPIISKENALFIREVQNPTERNKATVRLRTQGIRTDGSKVTGKGKIPEKWMYLIDAPFKISEQCCDIMKKAPMHAYERETQRKPYIGSMAVESDSRRKMWLKYGCNAYDNTRGAKSTPMSFWTENDVLRYIKENNLPYASIYGDIVEYDQQLDIFGEVHSKFKTTGLQRTGCIFCGFGVHAEQHPNRFEILKEHHPQLYKYCMKPVDEGGLGLDEVLNYINVSH